MDEPAEQVAVTQTIAARNPTRRKLTLRSAASHIEPVQEQPVFNNTARRIYFSTES